jgi:hypothetical protein
MNAAANGTHRAPGSIEPGDLVRLTVNTAQNRHWRVTVKWVNQRQVGVLMQDKCQPLNDCYAVLPIRKVRVLRRAPYKPIKPRIELTATIPIYVAAEPPDTNGRPIFRGQSHGQDFAAFQSDDRSILWIERKGHRPAVVETAQVIAALADAQDRHPTKTKKRGPKP